MIWSVEHRQKGLEVATTEKKAALEAERERGAAARAVGLTKVYGRGDTAVHALRDVTVEFPSGAFTAIMGPSGSGKSTLLHCLAGLDPPTGGDVYIGDVKITGLKDKELTRLRRDKIGFVFQAFNLLPSMTAEENILLPLSIAGKTPEEGWFQKVIDSVDLDDRLSHKPNELSGGQQQRVAAARALMTRPEIVFADEPTGNLDSRSSAEVLGFLQRSVNEFAQTIVMVTHDAVAASHAERILFLQDGRIVDDMTGPTVESILDRIKSLEA